MDFDGRGLHCGDVIEVLIEGRWCEARIEHSDDWYLVGQPASVNDALQCGRLLARRCL